LHWQGTAAAADCGIRDTISAAVCCVIGPGLPLAKPHMFLGVDIAQVMLQVHKLMIAQQQDHLALKGCCLFLQKHDMCNWNKVRSSAFETCTFLEDVVCKRRHQTIS
jgi:hypothetical protein